CIICYPGHSSPGKVSTYMCSDGWPASPYQNKTHGMECGGVVRTFGMAAGRIRDP
ncbi:GM13158, partial [Drosophila sechellia]